MYRRIAGLVIACFCAGQLTSQAQDFKLFDRDVQIHGFASQGFIYTNDNNWLTMNTSQGSGAFTEFGVNVSSSVTDKLRVGAQLYDRNLGRLGPVSYTHLDVYKRQVFWSTASRDSCSAAERRGFPAFSTWRNRCCGKRRVLRGRRRWRRCRHFWPSRSLRPCWGCCITATAPALPAACRSPALVRA